MLTLEIKCLSLALRMLSLFKFNSRLSSVRKWHSGLIQKRADQVVVSIGYKCRIHE